MRGLRSLRRSHSDRLGWAGPRTNLCKASETCAPKPIDPHLLARADRVIVVGRDAHVDAVPGMRASRVEIWDTDEPSTRGIEGEQRMRLIREDITARCRQLLTELS